MFFTQINQMMSQGVDITLVIRKKEGQLTVCSMPKANGLNDEAQNHIIPLTITGTPEELDNAFLQMICQPIQKTSGLLANLSLFEKQAEKAASNSKAAKELKDKEAKESKEKKERFDKLMKSAGELEAAQKYSDAIATLQHAKSFANDQSAKSVDEKLATLKGKLSQGSLFEMDTNPQPTQTTQISQQHPQVNTDQNMYPQERPPQQFHQKPMNGNYPNQNGELFSTRQPPTNNNAQANQNGLTVTSDQQERDYNPAYAHSMPVDYNAHREGEYDQYPDFPGHSNTKMFNY